MHVEIEANILMFVGTGLTSKIGAYFSPAATQSTHDTLSTLLNAYIVTSDPKSNDPQCANNPLHSIDTSLYFTQM